MTSTGPLNVAVVGTGYVGLTTGTCLAHLGHQVVCCDVDQRKVDLLNAGVIPIVEEGLEALVRESTAAGRLSFRLGLDVGVGDADVVFLCVPTPQDQDGSADLSFVQAAAEEAGPLLKPGAVVVNKSTVPVGSFHIVSDALARDDVFVVSNPEFLREGTAIDDFLHPDRVVIGADNAGAGDTVAQLYETLDCPIVRTDPASAEVIKYAANGFLAMKISFMNSVAWLCEHVGADVADVADALGRDQRIGDKFLNPGPGWGGSCFPKDSRALVAIADQHGYDFSLMRGVIDINEQQIDRMIHKVIRALGRFEHDRLAGRVVGALGLTFKAGTDDLRESPSLRILDELARRGATIQAYDPTTSGDLSPVQVDRLRAFDVQPTAMAAITGADVTVVLTEWPEFRTMDVTKVGEAMRGDAVVDCRNLLDPTAVRATGLHYDGVGRP